MKDLIQLCAVEVEVRVNPSVGKKQSTRSEQKHFLQTCNCPNIYNIVNRSSKKSTIRLKSEEKITEDKLLSNIEKQTTTARAKQTDKQYKANSALVVCSRHVTVNNFTTPQFLLLFSTRSRVLRSAHSVAFRDSLHAVTLIINKGITCLH